MSAAWLYGLMRAPADGPDLAARLAAAPITGLQGMVEIHDLGGGLVLAWAPCDGQPVAPRRRVLKDHARVLEALMEHGPLLPFRFGHITRDLARIATLAEAASAEIETHFARIDGHAEVGLRVDFDRDAALSATLSASPDLARQRDALNARGGGDRMAQIDLGRRVADALEDRRTAGQRALLRALAPLARDHVLQAPEDDVQVLRGAFLVPEGAVEAFTRKAEEAARALGFADTPPRLRLVHPTPPFNFVTLSLGADPDSEVA